MRTAFAGTSTNIRLQDWTGLLRGACLTVVNNGPAVIGAVNVSHRLDEVWDCDRETLRKLARDLAGEYGLVAEVDESGRNMHVRLSRPQSTDTRPETRETGTASRGASRWGPFGVAIRALRHNPAAEVEVRFPR
jgi:hypothetical protein